MNRENEKGTMKKKGTTKKGTTKNMSTTTIRNATREGNDDEEESILGFFLSMNLSLSALNVLF